MDIRDVFAANLRKARRNARLSQEELAHKAEIDRTYVSALERSRYAATVDMIGKLADALGIEPAELLHRQRKSRS